MFPVASGKKLVRYAREWNLAWFISFEGGEGAGKTSQAEHLVSSLQKEGIPAHLIHEPGTTSLGRYVRQYLKRGRDETISHGAELFMFAAARAELVAKVINPILSQNRGAVVVADRFADSTLAYQGYGRKLSLHQVGVVNALATQGLDPNLTFLLDCPPEDGLRRVGTLQSRLALDAEAGSTSSRIDHEGTRRFEDESLDFHKRVRAGYLELASQGPSRWRVLDATQPFEAVAESVWKEVQKLFSTNSMDDETETDLRLEMPKSRQ